MKKYKVILSNDERNKLNAFLKKERAAARKRIHAQILLRADEAKGQDGWKDVDIADAYGVSVQTVGRVRQRLVEQGFEAALQPRASQENRARKFDGEKEAKLVTLACSKAPEGYARWTMQLLADKMVELKYMESISDEAVRIVLKKTKLNLG
jgi:transposase